MRSLPPGTPPSVTDEDEDLASADTLRPEDLEPDTLPTGQAPPAPIAPRRSPESSRRP